MKGSKDKRKEEIKRKETTPAVPRPAVPSLNLPATPRPIFMKYVSDVRSLLKRISIYFNLFSR